MWTKVLPILIIGISAAVYHFSSKNLGKVGSETPWLVLMVVYTAAAIFSGVVAYFSGNQFSAPHALAGAALPYLLLLAVACVGIEGGYLWAYSSGWKVVEMMPLTCLTSGILVVAVSTLLLKEAVTPWSAVGLVIVIGGTAVMHWR